MKFLSKSVLVTLFFSAMIVAKWDGYLPFSPELTGSGFFGGDGVFAVPSKPSGKFADKAHSPYYITGRITGSNTASVLAGAQQAIQKASIDFQGLNKNKKKYIATLKQLDGWRNADVAAGRLFRPYVFYDVMGVMEWDFKGRKNDGKPDLKLFRPLDGDRYNQEEVVEIFPGRLALYWNQPYIVVTVGAYKELADRRWTIPAKNPGKFVVLDGYEIGGFTVENGAYKINQAKVLDGLRETDIRYLMEKNPRAAFQIASNFNCLEGGMGSNKALLESMQFTPTQGEEAALATMGGTIRRKYAEPPVNLLDQLADKITVKEGRIVGVKAAMTVADIDKVKIGLHENVDVTSGYYPPFSALLTGPQHLDTTDPRVKFLFDNHFVVKGRDPLMIFNSFIEYDKRPSVNLIFTAALNLNDRHIKNYDVTSQMVRDSARMLLKAAYAGTIYAAAQANTGKLYLTLVGCGAFKNELEWVLEALQERDITDVVKKSGLQVIIVLYPDLRTDRSFSPADTNKVKKCVAGLNAAITASSSDASEKLSSDDSEVKALAQALYTLL